MQIDVIKEFKVPEGEKIRLKDYDSAFVPNWASKKGRAEKKSVKKQAMAMLSTNKQRLAVMQELFWASDTYAMLIILQGMDAAGKDSIIRHVMAGVNPQGCEVHGFKTPSEEELDHDFLWRYMKALPERGRIGIFNRSYYEDVLIVKVRPEVFEKQKLPPGPTGKPFWEGRYEDINMFEKHLVRSGTQILKFFLHVSKEEQKKRLLKRLEDPDKHWKFSYTDLRERGKWKQYMEAYEDVLNETNTKWAPWYVIPSDKKWVTHAAIAEIIVSHINNLNLKYPVLTDEQSDALVKAKMELEKEN